MPLQKFVETVGDASVVTSRESAALGQGFRPQPMGQSSLHEEFQIAYLRLQICLLRFAICYPEGLRLRSTPAPSLRAFIVKG